MMKRVFVFILVLIILAFSVSPVFALDESAESSEVSYVSREPESKNYQWAYYLVGGVALIAVIGAVVYITKKK